MQPSNSTKDSFLHENDTSPATEPGCLPKQIIEREKVDPVPSKSQDVPQTTENDATDSGTPGDARPGSDRNH